MDIGVSPRALEYVRSRATGVMQAQCKIVRVIKPSFDQSTGTATSGARSVIYEGRCRVWEVVGGGTPMLIGEEEVEVDNTQLSLPFDVSPIPKRYDQVEITAHATDPEMVGKRFEINSGAMAGDLRATRRFSIRRYSQ